MWMLCGALSIFFTGITLYFTLCRKNGADWASVCALSFTAITLLLEYKMAVDWVCREDWAALLDVLAPMFLVLAGYVTVQILLNALALGIRRKKRSAGRPQTVKKLSNAGLFPLTYTKT